MLWMRKARPSAAWHPRLPRAQGEENKPEFTPHVDTGDYVIVINAEKMHVTGKKLDQKIYHNIPPMWAA